MSNQVDSLGVLARTGRLSNILRRQACGLCWVLWLGLGSSAQAKTCEQVRDDIAQSMDAAGLRGYSLQIVPAGTPLAGAKVVGNCAGGSRKIAYRRFALRQAQPLVSEAPPPPSPEPAPSLAAPAPEPKPEPRPVPKPVAQVPPPQPAPPAPVATRPVVPEPAPPAVAALPLPEPAPAKPVAQAEPAPPPPAPEPVVAEKALPAEAAPASQANGARPASASLAPEFLARHWAWLGGLLLLPLLAWLWRSRGGGVDAAGLPRGPRL